MTAKRLIEGSDILDLETYASQRKERRAEMIAVKKNRRLAIGPNATLHFESFATMLYQVQEMLHTERGGAAQLEDELRAYNPMIPKGNELTATFMLEYEDPTRRAAMLGQLGGIEETITIEFADHVVRADWEKEVDRTTSTGKTSALHFLHFPFTDEQAEAFRKPGQRVVLAVGHENYGHMAVVPEAMREELAGDL